MLFLVVEFQDNSVGIVRENWLTPQRNQCLWPPYKTASKFNKCLLKQLTENETWPNWPLHPIKRVMFETTDLQLARSKCKKAECESDLISDEGEPAKKRRKKPLVVSESDSEEEEIGGLKCPSPPTEIIKEKPVNRFIENSPQHGNVDEQNERNPTARPRFLLESFNVDSPVSSRSSSAARAASTMHLPKIALDKINESLVSIGSYLSDIQSDLKQLKATQNDILLRLSVSTPLTKITLPDELALPLNSVEELNAIQTWLEDEENQQNLINNLSFVGGNNTAAITRRVLQRLFSTSLARKCNWTGKNNKFSLKKIRLTQVIIDAVRSNKLAEKATDNDITLALTSWFRFARDRDGGRESRRASSTQ